MIEEQQETSGGGVTRILPPPCEDEVLAVHLQRQKEQKQGLEQNMRPPASANESDAEEQRGKQELQSTGGEMGDPLLDSNSTVSADAPDQPEQDNGQGMQRYSGEALGNLEVQETAQNWQETEEEDGAMLDPSAAGTAEIQSSTEESALSSHKEGFRSLQSADHNEVSWARGSADRDSSDLKRSKAAEEETSVASCHQRLQQLIEQADAELAQAVADRELFQKLGQLQRDLGEKRKALSVIRKRTRFLESRLEASSARDLTVNLQNRIAEREKAIEELKAEVQVLSQHGSRCDAIYEQLCHKLGGLPTQVKKTQGELLAMRKRCREQKKAIEAHQQELQSLLATAASLDREYLQRKSALDVVARRRRCEEVNLQEYELTGVMPLQPHHTQRLATSGER